MKWLRKVVATSLVLSLGSTLFAPPALAAFNQNKLISDGVFDNSGSMNAGQIDTFLNTMPNSCISTNSGFDARNPTGYSPSGGFTYGGFVSAGQVIATSAQVYGLNPQVLLTTLQKEQSLVVGGAGYCNNGDEHKYAAAAGYGCPDSGTVHNWSGTSLYRRGGVERTATGSTCVNSADKAGFSQQVIRAAWLLKFGQQRSLGNMNWAVIQGSWDNSDDPQSCYGGPVTEGLRQVCPSGATSYYDGYRTIDGQAAHMESGGTAALYWYTPHFHGNQNFVTIFEGWFGPTVPVKLTGSPSAISWGIGRIDSFTRGSDGMLWQKWFDNSGGWRGWGSLNVPVSSTPTVSSWASGRLDLFYINGSGDLGHYWFDNSAWQSVESLGKPAGNVTITGSPSAISWASGRIDVFARGSDGALWQKWFDASGGWRPWGRLGGNITSSPTVSSWQAGRLDIFANGTGGDLQHYWFDGTGWHGWESLGFATGGITTAIAPSGISWGPNRIDVFSRGNDGALWQKWFDASGGWRPWNKLGGAITSSPTVSSWQAGRLDIFGIGNPGDLQHYWFDETGWHGWESFGSPN